VIATSVTLPSVTACRNVSDSRTQSGTACGPLSGFTVIWPDVYPSFRNVSAFFAMMYIKSSS